MPSFPSFLWFTQPVFVVLQEVYTETVFVGNYGLAGFEIGVTTDELPGDGAGNVSADIILYLCGSPTH